MEGLGLGLGLDERLRLSSVAAPQARSAMSAVTVRRVARASLTRGIMP